MASIRLRLSLLSLLVLPACSTSARKYVDTTAGFSFTKGTLERFERLSAAKAEYLKDGVVLHVVGEGAQATLKIAERTQSFPLASGSRVILCEDGDYILLPLSSAGGSAGSAGN